MSIKHCHPCFASKETQQTKQSYKVHLHWYLNISMWPDCSHKKNWSQTWVQILMCQNVTLFIMETVQQVSVKKQAREFEPNPSCHLRGSSGWKMHVSEYMKQDFYHECDCFLNFLCQKEKSKGWNFIYNYSLMKY